MTGDTPDFNQRRLGVVMAVQREADGRWLLVRRAATVERAPLKIGFPGGEIEPGETQEQAVVREMQEELGVAAAPLHRVMMYDLPDRPWRLYLWTTQLLDEVLRPDPGEVAEVMWLTAQEGSDHPDALPGCRVFFEALLAMRQI